MAIHRVENNFYERIWDMQMQVVRSTTEETPEAALAYFKGMKAVEDYEKNVPWRKLVEKISYGDTYLDEIKKLTGDGKVIKQMEQEGIVFLNQPAYAGDRDVVDYFISMGADLNLARTPNKRLGITGDSPLTSAISHDDVNIFMKLLRAGADPVAPTGLEEGKTLLEIARYYDAEEIIKVLKNEKLMALLTDERTRALTKSFNEFVAGKVVSNKELNDRLRQADYADTQMFGPTFEQQRKIIRKAPVIFEALLPSLSSPATYIDPELLNEIRESALKEKNAISAVSTVKSAIADHAGDLYVKLQDVAEDVIGTYGHDKKLIDAFIKAARDSSDHQNAIDTSLVDLHGDLIGVAIKIKNKFFKP